MEAVRVRAECAQCGRAVPTDPAGREGWRHADFATADELDDVSAAMILCPDCDAEHLAGDFEPGEPG